MTKKNFEDHMQFVADHMYYAKQHIEAIMEDEEMRKAYEEASGNSLEDWIDEFEDRENHFNHYAFNSNIEDDEEDDYDDEEDDDEEDDDAVVADKYEFQDNEFEED